ncbi:DUF4269 domain-containing protein [Alkalicoccobacillus porphyridii]|uniref:DUF4269 domain-containing protein n=1 Tax=Alkalicoccobacillus porphyridii TaxID=2597270 RepID=A0A554A1Q3_9BACI|nr:DUF4269 domain-containing protein [Alkalicoccobacillus porphyridii]TSB47586.1 DUF4269 domain-containing protein [Alkalicoccobacillus porphyridii]
MFRTLDYLMSGTPRQRAVFQAIDTLGVMRTWSDYSPTLCGTIPIGIDVSTSDLDIVMEIHERDFSRVEEMMIEEYGYLEGFRMKKMEVKKVPTIKVNFIYKYYQFELFGQPKCVTKQHAYLHMVIEAYLLKQRPLLRRKIIHLKTLGVKTEPAFCTMLGLQGDPYEQLLQYGREHRII